MGQLRGRGARRGYQGEREDEQNRGGVGRVKIPIYKNWGDFHFCIEGIQCASLFPFLYFRLMHCGERWCFYFLLCGFLACLPVFSCSIINDPAPLLPSKSRCLPEPLTIREGARELNVVANRSFPLSFSWFFSG